MSQLKELFEKYKEMIMYLVFGVGTTAVNWITYTLLIEVCGMKRLTIANIIAWIVAVVFAYITNKLWVFESKSWKLDVVVKEAGAFLGARIFSGIFEMGLFPLLMYLGFNQSLFGVEGMVAKVLIGVVVIVLNYIFSKLLVFRNKEDKQQA